MTFSVLDNKLISHIYSMFENMKRFILLPVVLLLFSIANAANQELVHVRLIDRLDRPDDGYCLDILGTGDTLRLDLPLFSHNCKPVAHRIVL